MWHEIRYDLIVCSIAYTTRLMPRIDKFGHKSFRNVFHNGSIIDLGTRL